VRQGSFTGIEQEVIFLTASLMNECQYCIAAHSALASETYVMPDEHLSALRSGRPLGDPKLQSLHALTRSLIDTRGQPDEATVQSFLDAGYNEAQMFEALLAISLKMLSNFAGRLALPEPDERFAPFALCGRRGSAPRVGATVDPSSSQMLVHGHVSCIMRFRVGVVSGNPSDQIAGTTGGAACR
jgi:AhpD family alkylhydroperoxidase